MLCEENLLISKSLKYLQSESIYHYIDECGHPNSFAYIPKDGARSIV